MAERTDVELLTELHDALAAPPVRPDAMSLARLHATLAELEDERTPLSITAATHRSVTQRSSIERRRRLRARSSILVASAVAGALSVGVAAAAVATNTLPGPTRAFAYDLGLPVTSPSLHQAQQTETQLRRALTDHDTSQSRVLAQQLISQMERLNDGDLSQIRASADTLLVEVGVGLPMLSTTSPSPVTTTVTIPSTSGASTKIPGVSVPSVSVPSVSTPSVSVPRVRIPSVSIPGAVPGVSLPSVSTPSVSVPRVTLPPITVPTIKLPGLPPL